MSAKTFKVGDIVTANNDTLTGEIIMNLGGDMCRLRLPHSEATVRTVHMRHATEQEIEAYAAARGVVG